MTRGSTKSSGLSERRALNESASKNMACYIKTKLDDQLLTWPQTGRDTPEAEEARILQLRRIEIEEEDLNHARNCGGIQLHLDGMSSIYIGFNRDDIGRSGNLRVCEIFFGMEVKIIHARPFTDGEPSSVGEIHRFETDGESITVQDVTHTTTGSDIIVAVNSTWYKIEISEDDKMLCLNETADGDEVPILCGYNCRDGKDHHYFVRLRKEWRIPMMREVDQTFRFEKHVRNTREMDIGVAFKAFERLSYD